MKRRELILLLGGAMTASHALRAQQKAMPVIGVLGNTSPGPAAPFLAAFHQGLMDTGYVEGQNVSVEYHWAEGRYDRFPAFATDLVGRKVDVIVTFAVASALAAKSATSTIPIVFTTGGDAVAPLQDLHPYYGLLRPCAPHRYSGSRGGLPLELLPWHRDDRFSRSATAASCSMRCHVTRSF